MSNELVRELIEVLVNNALGIISAVTALIITIIKTKQSSIQKKVDNALTLNDYTVEVEGKEYNLAELTIKKSKKINK